MGGPAVDQVIDARDGDLEFLGDGQRVAGMIAMAMGQQDMGRALDGLGAGVFRKDRIAGNPGVDQDYSILDFQAKARMSKPGQFHRVLLPVSRAG